MQFPELEFLKAELYDHTLWVRLDRPPVNALSRKMVAELLLLAEWIPTNSEIWLVVVSNNGKVFCAGADLKERETVMDAEVATLVKSIQMAFQYWALLPVPVIMGVNGAAIGGGLELALTGDLIAVSASTRLGFPETHLGIIPGAGGTQRMPRRTNLGTANKWILTAEIFPAEEALKDGVVQYVFQDEAFEAQLMKLAAQVGKNAPIALRQAKHAIQNGASIDLQTALELESTDYEVLIPTHDRMEALEAFKAKRSPKWTGK